MMRTRVIVACLASIALHVGVLVTLRSLTTLPDVGFEIELPAEIELGVIGGASEPIAPTPEASAEPASPAQDETTVSSDDVVVISAHAIPGNGTNGTRSIDSLHRAGAEVRHGPQALLGAF